MPVDKCQSCSTLRHDETPKNLPRPEMASVLDRPSTLHCNQCKKLVYEVGTDKCVENPYWGECQQLVSDANGDTRAAFRSVIDEVHSKLEIAKATKVKRGKNAGNAPYFLEPSRLQSEWDNYSHEFVERYVSNFASQQRIRYTGHATHPATELRLNPKPTLVDGIFAMILVDTFVAHTSEIRSSNNTCVHCNSRGRYASHSTSVLSFSKHVGCAQCIAQWAQQYFTDGGDCAVIPSLCERPASMVLMSNAAVAAVLAGGIMLSIPFDVLASFVHSKGMYNPSRSQIEEDALKLEAKRNERSDKEARISQEKLEKLRSLLPPATEDVYQLTEGETIAATEAVPAILDVVSKLAMTVDGTSSTMDVLASSNFTSVVPYEDGNTFTFLKKDEHISHIAQRERLFIIDASTGVALVEGEHYDHHNYNITGANVELGMVLLQVEEAVKTSRKKGSCSVVTIQLTKPCHYVDAKIVEKVGHTITTGNVKIIPMEDPNRYTPGNISKRTPFGVTHLCLFIDACNLVKSGRARFCITGATQAFVTTMNTMAPFSLDLAFWSKYGDRDSLAAKKQQGVRRDNLDDTKPAARPDEKPAALTSTAKAKPARSNQTGIDDVVASTSKSKPAGVAKSAAAARALHEVDANSITPNPPKKMRPNPSKSKTTKLPTPKQLKDKIVVKSGTISLDSKKLEQMFACYDEAEFKRLLPSSINDGNRSRIILVVGSSTGNTRKVQTAERERLTVIDEEAFMKMLKS